jgi:hypothetical protein
MQYSNDLIAFLTELYKRMALKSPKFFQVLQAIGMTAALVTGIPLAIQQIEMFTGLKIALPDVVNHWVVRVVFWCGIVVKLMAKLPVTNPARPVTTDGKIAAPRVVMPYTEKKS